MSRDKQKITVINKFTGEVIDIEYSNKDEAEQAYHLVKGLNEATERAKKKLLAYISEGIDKGETQEFSDGMRGFWISGKRAKYRPETVCKYLDEDQVNTVMEVNGSKLKELLSQLVEDGHGIPGAWDEIKKTADVTYTKPYFAIKK